LLIETGEELFMEVDMERYVLSFTNKNRKITHKLEKEHWKTQSVYVFVQVYEVEGFVCIVG
jgi:hypothetical protein